MSDVEKVRAKINKVVRREIDSEVIRQKFKALQKKQLAATMKCVCRLDHIKSVGCGL